MSYQVLARKWRPRAFTDVVGQEHALRVLRNALKQKRLHHAYLFTGTRGVGKTTLARIVTKCLCCARGVGADPCGKCAACRDIDNGRHPDLIEVDAASRARVEETRELMENVPYAPTAGAYKVYLIDEVHMFSGHSFNALLKTLEEPPRHVQFLFATTEPKRLPVTILSRCLQLHLSRLGVEHIAARLRHIVEQEQVTADGESLELLAHAADGSLRDALSLLDRAISDGGGQLHTKQVHEMLGTVERGMLDKLLEAVSGQDGPNFLATLEEIAALSPDYATLLADLLRFLQRIALVQATGGSPAQDWKNVVPWKTKIPPEEVQLLYEIALRGRRDLEYAPDPQTAFEMCMIRMLNFYPADGESQSAPPQATRPPPTPPVPAPKPPLKPPLAPPSQAAPGQRPAGRTVATSVPDSQTNSPANSPTNSPANSPAAAAATPDTTAEKQLGEWWLEQYSQLELRGLARQIAKHCTPLHNGPTGLTLALDPAYAQLLSDPEKSAKIRQELRDALQQHLGKAFSLNLVGHGNGAAKTAAASERLQQRQAQEKARRLLSEDQNVRLMKELFDATLDPDSVTSGQPATEP